MCLSGCIFSTFASSNDSMEKIIYNLRHTFFRNYGQTQENPRIFFAPGRVNLIGEHTDYNGGFVFPCALSFGTYLAIRPASHGMIRMASMNFEGSCELKSSGPFVPQSTGWCNYPLGVLNEFLHAGIKPEGLDLLFFGDIPQGAGLSSSASIEMVTAIAINTLFQCGYDAGRLAILSQHAENTFVGMNCGIMDQFASGLGKKDHALVLNCNTLAYSLVPLILPEHAILISNTNKNRKLVGSKYNERREECQQAVECLKTVLPIQTLSDVNVAQFNKFGHLISPDVLLKRARHVITENQRVVEAVNALTANDLKTMGNLMNASHQSLALDYEVSCAELDIMVEEIRKHPGALGARMTGAGFGGCTVSIVERKAIPEIVEQTGRAYEHRTGLRADFYIASTADGACELV